MNESETTGTIFNIQRFSLEDGPGIRTTVFLKGCPLRCLWCSNPESQSPRPQVAHRDSLCIGCLRCAHVCSKRAITIYEDQNKFRIRINRKNCDDCGACVESCVVGALKIFGQTMSIQEVLNEVERDTVFYLKSGGGVTASGGEPLVQANFVAELFYECRRVGLHTALDTSGYADQSVLNELVKEADLVLYDIKAIDRDLHKKLTGADNEVILRNAQFIASKGVPTIFRIPIIPFINDMEQNLEEIAHFIRDFGNNAQVDLLPYHRLGAGKYEMLDMDYDLVDLRPPSHEQLTSIKERFEQHGLNCVIQ